MRTLALAALLACAACARKPRAFVVGAKPGAESEISAELAAAMIEDGLEVPVERKLGLGAAAIFSALKSGKIDAYAESAGAGLALLARGQPDRDPVPPEAEDELLDRLAREFARRWGVRWLKPLGVESEWELVMRRTHARALGVRTIAELARLGRGLRCGFEPEFADRPDGYRSLRRRYDGDVCSCAVHMSRDAMYQALTDGRIDLASARSTDGNLGRLGLAALDDDRGALRSYPVALLLSPRVEDRFPGAAERLGRLSGRVSSRDMGALVARVEFGGEKARDAARAFLRGRGLLR